MTYADTGMCGENTGNVQRTSAGGSAKTHQSTHRAWLVLYTYLQKKKQDTMSKKAQVLVPDDELEQNWAAEAVAIDDDEEAVSAGSDDEFEEEYDLELASNKRARDESDDADQEMAVADSDEQAAAKKQKTEVR